MMKHSILLKYKEFESKSVKALSDLLGRIPFVQIEEVRQGELWNDSHRSQPDFVARVIIDGQLWHLVGECKLEGQPRKVREAVLQVKDYLSRLPGSTKYGVVMAPFISEQSADACREEGVGFLDLAGNCRMSFDQVFIETRAAENPFRVRRDLRSLFTRKAGRVLRVLLTPPVRSWKVLDLEAATGVSRGHVSNVRNLLLNQELAVVDGAGLRLTKPEELLRAWQKEYEARPRTRGTFYTLLHGERLEAALRGALQEAGAGEHAVLASFSAARWLAPYIRQEMNYIYADPAGSEVLRRHLHLEPVPLGENVVIEEPREDDVFAGRIEPVQGIWCSGLVQTWLDLSAAGERGREAAEHLLQHKLLSAWKDTV